MENLIKNITAMSEAIIEAAESTGIQLTLVNCALHLTQTFSQQEISQQQKPFYNDTASYLKRLMDQLISLF